MSLKKSIAVLAPVNFEHAHALINGVRMAARQYEWDVIPLHFSQEPAIYRLIETGRVQGVIGDLISDRLVASMPRHRPPAALVHTGFPLATVSSVSPDDERIGTLAARHFISRGYRQLRTAVLPGDHAGAARSRGFSTHAADAGVTVQSLPPLPLTASSRQRAASLFDIEPPVGVFCQDDGIARRLVEGCQQAGLPVPEAVAVIGVGDSRLDSFFAGIGLSSIALDFTAIGQAAARLLYRQLLDPAAAPILKRIAPGELILGETTGHGTLNPLAVRALDYMEKHLADPIGIEEIARHTGASRRLLEIRFREAFDRSPHAELTRLRLDRARALLTDSRLGIAQIGARCGYPEVSHFYVRFKQHHGGTPPAAWRKLHAGGRAPSAP